MENEEKDYGYNIKVNYKAIAKGMYDIIVNEHPQGACLMYGMLPSDLMESLENGLKDKIPDNSLHVNSGEFFDGKPLRSKIIHDVTCEILALATKSGVCIV